MAIEDYLANEKFACITRDNRYGITGAKPGELYYRIDNIEEEWTLLGDCGGPGLISPSQKVAYDANQDKWLEIMWGPHCISCTCYGDSR